MQLEMNVDDDSDENIQKVSLFPMVLELENRHSNIIYSQTVHTMPSLHRGHKTDIQVKIPLTLAIIGALEPTRIETDGDVHFSTEIHGIYQYISPGIHQGDTPTLTNRQIGGQEHWRITSSDWVRKALQGRTLTEMSKESALRLEELRMEKGKSNLDELISDFYDESQKPLK